MRLSCPTLGRDECLEIRRVDDRYGASIAALRILGLANAVFIGGEYTAATGCSAQSATDRQNGYPAQVLIAAALMRGRASACSCSPGCATVSYSALGSAVSPDTRFGVQFAELIEPIGASIQSIHLDGVDECMS